MNRRKNARLSAMVILASLVPLVLVAQAPDLEGLDLQELEGTPRTLVSSGAQAAGLAAQSQIAAMLSRASETLGVASTPTLAVLNPQDWSALGQPIPYGLPWGTGTTLVLPATAEGAIVDVLAGFVGQELATAQLGNVSLHEAGHIVANDLLGAAPTPRWFSEFFASYLAYDFVVAERPDDAAAFREIAILMADGAAPPSYDLTTFERDYFALLSNPPVYGWYQALFNRFVAELHSDAGIDFALGVAAAVRSARFDDSELWINELEEIAPGFVAWAEAMPGANR